jgi:hypothetical protein
MPNNVILGAGIAGLIWAYYHKDYYILSDQIGGQMMSYFDLGPRYLHNKYEGIPTFLKSLDIPIKIRTIKVGYIDDSGWVENPSLTFRQQYYMKSRGVDNLSGFDSTVLNTNIKEFNVCDVDFKELINKLFEILSSRIYAMRVDSIDLKERLIVCSDSGYRTKFDNLVSTIPLNIFCHISGLNKKLEAMSMVYCLMSDTFFDLKDFDFVYDNRATTSFHRMTKCIQGVVCDLLENKKQEFIDSTSSKPALAINVVKNSQIISLEKDFELEDKTIKFVGRYGTWNRKHKTETIIEQAQNA